MPANAQEILRTLLKHLGFEDATITQTEGEDGVTLDVTTDDPGRLIGRQGQTLADLQYLVNRIIFRQDKESPRVTLDVGGYRSQQKEALVKKAKEAVEKLRKWREVVELEPLSSHDRYTVHNALKSEPDVVTESIELEGTDMKSIILRLKDPAD